RGRKRSDRGGSRGALESRAPRPGARPLLEPLMPERILALRPRAMGDVVLTTPALRSLKRGHPGAELEVVTDPRYAPLLEGLPEIDRVLPLDRGAASTARLIAELRRRRWALAVDFFGNPRSAFITALSGAAVTAGYDLRGRRYAYRVRVPRNPPPGSPRREYAAATHLRLAAAVGGVADGEDARVSVSPGDRPRGADLRVVRTHASRELDSARRASRAVVDRRALPRLRSHLLPPLDLPAGPRSRARGGSRARTPRTPRTPWTIDFRSRFC